MKKKVLIFVLAVISAVLCAIGFAACGNDTNNGGNSGNGGNTEQGGNTDNDYLEFTLKDNYYTVKGACKRNRQFCVLRKQFT